ncbi:MAG: hypothetical protein JXB47_18475 [Anaerolineae bacterium]|nr:hypothetical protein [Anaerolineae bacterium]
MSTELEVLVSNLYVVGGRAVKAAPPGALVQQAPRRSPRVRANDRFVALLDITERARLPVRAPASLYEEMVRLAADTYFQSSGTMTSGLREAIDAVNEALMAHHREIGTVHQAHIICAAVRNGEVYLARAGACQAFLQQSGQIICFPDSPAELESTPLGLRTAPPVALNRYTVAPGDILVLADKPVATLPAARRDAALAAADAAAVVEALKPLAGSAAAALVVQLVTPEAHAAVAAHATEAAAPARTPRAARARVDAAGEKLSARVARVDLGAGLRRVGSVLALAVARLAALFNRLFDVFFPEPTEFDEDAGARIPTSLAAGLTVLIASIVTVGVVGLMLRNYGRDRCDDFVRLYENEAVQARELVGHDREEAREAWVAVKARAAQAIEVCPPTDPRPLQALNEARGFIDEYDQVVRPRPSVTLLRRYPAIDDNLPVLYGPLLHAPDIYVLDTANVALYRDQLNENGFQLVKTDSKPVLKKGDTVSGFVIERLVDMTWMSEGPVSNMLVSLEPTRGVLIAYSPALPPQALSLVGWEAWETPVAIATWGGNFYILDSGADQVWRYRITAGGEYSDPPERYFTTLATTPDLASAIDFDIDDQGYVYVLFAGGEVVKYYGGEPVEDFGLATLPVPLHDVRAMHIDSSPFAQSLYLVDTGGESIFETTLRGNFTYHFKAANEEAFQDLHGLAIKPSTDDLYVAANDGLYHFKKAGTQP